MAGRLSFRRRSLLGTWGYLARGGWVSKVELRGTSGVAADYCGRRSSSTQSEADRTGRNFPIRPIRIPWSRA
jgi:hypothetical protein